MRIIAGKYRGRRLKSPPSLQVRPTSDRLRETLFNILAPRIVSARFLDLCAGSGAVGLEALSRGADHATLVDRSRKACDLMGSNLALCRIPEGQAEVAISDAAEFLGKAIRCKTAPWDVIFFDPPYAADYRLVLNMLGVKARALLAKDGLLVVEHSNKKDLDAEFGQLCRRRVLSQGDSALSFYEPSAGNV